MKFKGRIDQYCLRSKNGQHFMRYESLKNCAHNITGATGEGEFLLLFNEELERIKTFINLKLQELRMTLQRLQYYRDQEKCGGHIRNTDSQIPEKLLFKEFIDDFVTELEDMEKFIMLNREGMDRVIEKHDLITGITSDWYFSQNHGAFFARYLNELDAFLFHISILYTETRSKDKAKNNKIRENVEEKLFERNILKHLVKTEDVFAVKTELIKHLPISIRNDMYRISPQLNCNPEPHESLIESTPPFMTLVSSVFLDNSDLLSYHSLQRLDESATAIRLRWHNLSQGREVVPLASPLDSIVYVEKKTYNSEREPIASLCDSAKPETRLRNEAQKVINRDNLEPLVRTACKRMIFQSPDDNEVRITLDSDLIFVDEGGRQNSQWKRNEDEIVENRHYCEFPYSILKVELGSTFPEWLRLLLEHPSVRHMEKFSKSQQATTCFYPHRIKEFPDWFADVTIHGSKTGFSKVCMATISRNYYEARSAFKKS
ncbi:vacuolar transporter chaperone 4-like [Lingula anatina]|uniref:Vacuolar transporter chaperone 4-like n=1 Tax=Lingula anatina TaxID=7574 RepID=A0A1S3KHT0_LINAN|nr:vacuolar transporter chaperone 4-like [Lingula anatina]|eukprot:XP_013422057.1 vacuolar transporter chaperone 4-like [Lingula anatina]